MTTAAEIRQLVAAGATEAQRLVLLPISVLASPAGLASLTREVVGLANRDGGRVVLGATADGKLEQPLPVPRERVGELIDEIATRMISPPLRCAVELLGDAGGAAVVVRVPPRASGAYRSDDTYVRVGDRTRTATPEQVAWLQRVRANQAAASSTFEVRVAGLVPAAGAMARATAIYADLLARVPATVAAGLAADPARRCAAWAELAPWVLLRDLDAAFAGRPGSVFVPLSDLAVPRSSAFAGGGGVAELLGEAPRGLLARWRRRPAVGFHLPGGCEPHVDVHRHSAMGRVMLAHSAWTYTFSARPAGEPEGDTVRLQVERNLALAFPERAGQIEAQADGEAVRAIVEDGWASVDGAS